MSEETDKLDLPGPYGGKLVIFTIAAAGVIFTLRGLETEVFDMAGMSWVTLLLVIAVAGALARVWPTPWKMVGLP